MGQSPFDAAVTDRRIEINALDAYSKVGGSGRSEMRDTKLGPITCSGSILKNGRRFADPVKPAVN